MIGVNFQPGAQGDGSQPGQARPPQGSGVQEAIKVLSLRLPKVVGAQGATPQALLQGQGSGGSRVDSIVNQVLSRIMPAGQPQGMPRPQPQANLSAPSMPSGPSFTGAAQPNYQPQAPTPSYSPMLGQTPRIIVDPTHQQGDFTVGRDGRTVGPPPGSIVAPTPNFNIPALPSALPDMFGWSREPAPPPDENYLL